MSGSIGGDYAEWTVTWPWPQVFFTEYGMVAVAKCGSDLHVYELHEYVGGVMLADDVGNIGTVATISAVDLTSFQSFYVIGVLKTDGDGVVSVDSFYRLPASAALVQMPTASVPEFITCCNFNNQAIIGGVVNEDSAIGGDGLNVVMWSGIGNFDFRPGTDKTAGYMSAPFAWHEQGMIHKVRKLGKGIVVYGTGGVFALMPKYIEPVYTMGMVMLPSAGVMSGNHVAGDSLLHMYIDGNGELYTINQSFEVTKLGYKEYMSDILDDTNNGPVIVSYAPQKKRFYICNGARGFAHNEFGLFETHQLVTSCGVYGTTLCGFFADTEDYEWRITTDTIDNGLRGMKTFGHAEVGINHENDDSELMDVYTSADYRYDYQTPQETFSTLGWTRLNPEGVALLNITAPEIRFKIKGSDYRGGTINLDYANLRVKFSDKRFVRGMYNAGKNE